MASTRITTTTSAATSIPQREPILSTGPDGKVLVDKKFELDRQGGDPSAIPSRQETRPDSIARTGHKEFSWERDFGADWGINRDLPPELAEKLRQQYGVEASGSIRGPSIKVAGSLDYSLGVINGLDIDANLVIDAKLFEAKGKVARTFSREIRGEKFDVTVELEGEAGVKLSAEANLKIHVGTLGRFELSAAGRAFAGAHGSLKGKVTMAVNGTEVAAGKLSFDASLGLSASGRLDLAAQIPTLADAKRFNVSGTWKNWQAKASLPVTLTAKVDLDAAGVVDPVAARSTAYAMLFAGPHGPINQTQGLRPSEILKLRELNLPTTAPAPQ